MSWKHPDPPEGTEIFWTLPPAAQTQASFAGRRVLVMGSGSGSNFEALVTALRPWGVSFPGLFCDRREATILDRASRLGVPVFPLTDEERRRKRLLNDAVLRFLEEPHDFVALAGYMKILPARVVTSHPGKILNLHPSLLPDFPGLRSIERAYEAGVEATGISIHWASEEVDAGPLLAQARLFVDHSQPLEALEERIHELEHWLYPRVVLRLLEHRANALSG